MGLLSCATMFYFKINLRINFQKYKKDLNGLFSATREYEVGIASNRLLECNGEYVLEFCTHRPSRYGNQIYLKTLFKVKRGLE